MKRYLGNLWIRIGLFLIMFGWGPLLAIIFLSAAGLWPDPNPNPIGPGLLFFFTAWPAIISLGIGYFQVRRKRHQHLESSSKHFYGAVQTGSDWLYYFSHPSVRTLIGIVGFTLILYGAKAMIAGAEGRGPAASLVLGVVALYWSILGRLPSWFRR
jgi:hypothetical protein